MEKRITFVGLDAHKESIKVAVLLPDERNPVEWQLANEKAAVRRMLRKLERLSSGEVRFCYEAGPCGYALQRWIQEAGAVCVVVAPSLIPRKPGDRIKTDRRDARKLAELYRAGLLTEVHAPTPADEAARDLCRAREDAQEDLMRCRHRLSKMLLRRGWTWNGTKRAWSQGHRLWLRSLRLEHQADQVVLEDYLLAIEHLEQRLPWLEQRIEQLSQQPAYADAVAALRCFRGIDTITAMGLVTELHDFMRFNSARGLMAFLGLVPSEHSSGESERRGGITKAGNRHARRLLIEAAWHYRHRPNAANLKRRRERASRLTSSLSPTRRCSGYIAASAACSRKASHDPRSSWRWPVNLLASSGPLYTRRRLSATANHTLFALLNFGGRSRRMRTGTIRRIRVAALRQAGSASLTRDIRPRCLSTENGHAALRSAQPAYMRMTRRRSVLPRPSSAAPKEDQDA